MPCHLDAMVGMVIRDLPADIISLKLGVNTIGETVLGKLEQQLGLNAE